MGNAINRNGCHFFVCLKRQAVPKESAFPYNEECYIFHEGKMYPLHRIGTNVYSWPSTLSTTYILDDSTVDQLVEMRRHVARPTSTATYVDPDHDELGYEVPHRLRLSSGYYEECQDEESLGSSSSVFLACSSEDRHDVVELRPALSAESSRPSSSFRRNLRRNMPLPEVHGDDRE